MARMVLALHVQINTIREMVFATELVHFAEHTIPLMVAACLAIRDTILQVVLVGQEMILMQIQIVT